MKQETFHMLIAAAFRRGAEFADERLRPDLTFELEAVVNGAAQHADALVREYAEQLEPNEPEATLFGKALSECDVSDLRAALINEGANLREAQERIFQTRGASVAAEHRARAAICALRAELARRAT